MAKDIGRALQSVAIVGAHNTPQARSLPGQTSWSVTLDAARGALRQAGLGMADVDGFNVTVGLDADAGSAFAYDVGAEGFWLGREMDGVQAVLEAALAVASGECRVALIASGQASLYTDRDSTAPWTRPTNEFIETWGLHTAVEWALPAQRYMHEFGVKPEDLAHIPAAIRNYGAVNPNAVYYGRGPFTPDDILASRMVASPYRLLDCATTSEGGSAVVLTTMERARDLPAAPVRLLGGGREEWGPTYVNPPTYERTGTVGRRAAAAAFAQAGIGRDEVDVFEVYDNFTYEVVRYFEAYGYCAPGEGAQLLSPENIRLDGRFPICTDGGVMSHSHTGYSQLIQKVVRAVQQVRGEANVNQVPGAKVALANWPKGLLLMTSE
ncbi:thiolase family protein [Yinghuangia sp. YIM S09857]|uniref:thiolase family protein n=1 Tax=Yinghuangia sp. YIM S09857 TaxID=3436929 RepID=UPI003F532883